jgi:hypothetical protein
LVSSGSPACEEKNALLRRTEVARQSGANRAPRVF